MDRENRRDYILGDRADDEALPQLDRLREKPSLERIVSLVSEAFAGSDVTWARGRRSDDAGRAMTAYLARRHFGYPAKLIAQVLGYTHSSSVSHAVRRIESGTAQLKTTARRLGRKLRSR